MAPRRHGSALRRGRGGHAARHAALVVWIVPLIARHANAGDGLEPGGSELVERPPRAVQLDRLAFRLVNLLLVHRYRHAHRERSPQLSLGIHLLGGELVLRGSVLGVVLRRLILRLLPLAVHLPLAVRLGTLRR